MRPRSVVLLVYSEKYIIVVVLVRFYCKDFLNHECAVAT